MKKRYYLLQEGEIIAQGDESLHPKFVWAIIAAPFIGQAFRSNIFHPIRREVSVIELTPAKVQYIIEQAFNRGEEVGNSRSINEKDVLMELRSIKEAIFIEFGISDIKP